ncbi:hypothetical protein D3C87_1736130 [compost metagenome]
MQQRMPDELPFPQFDQLTGGGPSQLIHQRYRVAGDDAYRSVVQPCFKGILMAETVFTETP